MDHSEFWNSTKLAIRDELSKLPTIDSVEGLRTLCINVEQKVLSLCIVLTNRYANILFASIAAGTSSDYIIDDGNFYEVTLADDISEKSQLLVGIKLVNNTKMFPLVDINIKLDTTGKYNKIRIVIPRNLRRNDTF